MTTAVANDDDRDVTSVHRSGMLVHLSRAVRKHRAALLVIILFNLIFFYPSLFMQRVISPVDVLAYYDPFATVRPATPQNGTLNDIATSYLTLMDMLKSDRGSFHWNRYVGSGIPGFGSVGAAVLSPFVFFPVLLLPFKFFCTGILLLKINVPFFFSYLWLREERLGKIPAVAGAMALSGAGIYAVWWLWPASNAIVLYPALLFLISRLMHGKRISFALSALLAFSFAVSGFPATIAYGAWMAVLYALFLAMRNRSLPVTQLSKAIGGAGVAALIAAPLVLPFISLIRRTGYLAGRATAGIENFYPLDHLASFIDPYRLGNPAAHLWYGDARLNASNNFVEATIFLGVVPLLLVIPALFNRRGKSRFFWLIFGSVVLAGMFGAPVISSMLDSLPGIQYSPLSRLRFLLPVPVAYLAACGTAVLMQLVQRLYKRYSRSLAAFTGFATAVAIAIPLAFFAAGFYPYIPADEATIPESPTVAFLQDQPPPFRIAPAFNWLFPNSAEYYRLEDIRSHFSSEEKYRRILNRISPGSFGASGTVTTFNSLHFNVRDPFVSFLNVRYLVEQPSIDILRWEVEKNAIPAGTLSGEIELPPGGRLVRDLEVPDASGIEIAIAGIGTKANDAGLLISLLRPDTGEQLFQRRLAGDEIRMSKLNLPLRGIATAGERIRLELLSRGVEASFLRSEAAEGGDPLFVRFTTSPLILLHDNPDGRVFQNLNALPRFYPVWTTRTLGFEELLADMSFDPATEAVLSDQPADGIAQIAAVPADQRNARVQIVNYAASLTAMQTTSDVPFLLASSEKLTPELQITVDGDVVEPLEINGMFAAVAVESGTHVVRFERRIGRGAWIPSMIGVLLLMAGAGWEMRGRRK